MAQVQVELHIQAPRLATLQLRVPHLAALQLRVLLLRLLVPRRSLFRPHLLLTARFLVALLPRRLAVLSVVALFLLLARLLLALRSVQARLVLALLPSQAPTLLLHSRLPRRLCLVFLHPRLHLL